MAQSLAGLSVFGIAIRALSYNNNKLYFKSISPRDVFDAFEYDSISYEKLSSDNWNLTPNDIAEVLKKINQQPQRVRDVFARIFRALQQVLTMSIC